MIPSDLPIEFKSLRLPIRLTFSITINKAQEKIFSRGQYYMLPVRAFVQKTVKLKNNMIVHN